MDPVYGYQAVNVEAQLRTPTSLLRWLHRFIALRKEHPVFGLGTYEPLVPSNPRIFAHIRRFEDDSSLCVHNLARSAQAVELDLSAYRGRYPVEMFGRIALPADRRAALPADAGAARLLLVPARARRGRGRRRWTRLTRPQRSAERASPPSPAERAAATGCSTQRWFGVQGRASSREFDDPRRGRARRGQPGSLLAARARRASRPARTSSTSCRSASAPRAATEPRTRRDRARRTGWPSTTRCRRPPTRASWSRGSTPASEIETAARAAALPPRRTERPGSRRAPPARPMGAEQSNTSVVIDERIVAEGLPHASSRASTPSSRCCAS